MRALGQHTTDGVPLHFDGTTPLATSTCTNCSLTLGDFAEHAARGDDFVADAEVRDHLAVFFLSLVLRPDQQEIENDEDQDQRQEAEQRIGLPARLRVGVFE